MPETARALADGLVDAADAAGGTLPAPLPVSGTALAWALKGVCFDAWNTAPARAVRCAQLLQQLLAVAAPDEQPEVQAVGHWVQGIADLCEGQTARAVASLDAAHAAFSALDQAAHAAQTRVSQVMALSLLGRQDEAVQCGHSALQQFLLLGDELAAGKVEVNLGTLASRQDRHAEAARLFRSAGVRAARAQDHRLSIHADIALAHALTWQGDFDEALRINQRARMRAENHGLAVTAAMARSAIGRIELNRGRHHLALRELAAACKGFAEAGAPPQQCLEAEATLADAYAEVNLLPEAVALYQQVIQRADAVGARVEQARATLGRARALDRLGEAGAALAALAQARALFEAQDNAASVAFTDLSLAELQLRQGQAAQAQDSAGRARQTLAGAGIPGWLLRADTTRAEALAAEGRTDEALDSLQRTLAQAESQGLRAVAGACHRALGQLAVRQGQGQQAWKHLGTALALIDEARLAQQGDSFRTALGVQAEEIHDQMVRLAVRAKAPPPALLTLLEQGRARALALGIQDASTHGPDDTLDGLRERLQWAREQWRAALATGDAGAVLSWARRVAGQEQGLLEAHRRAQLAPAGGPDDAPSPATPATEPAFSVAALLAALPEDTALVAFHQLGPHLVACVATRAGVRALVTDAQGLDDRLTGLRFQIEGQRFGHRGLQAHAEQLQARTRAHLQALHGMVWSRVAPLVRRHPKVVVVPHRNLHYLPFAALHDGQAWLAEQHEISLAPSALLWLNGRATAPRRPRRVLALGHGGPGLPEVQAELQSVTAAFGSGARILQGAEANRRALAEALPGQDVLHLACHGQFRADSPSFSSLDLADGPLTLLDAQRLPVAGMLVALSACETGLSKVAPGDELLGLVRGFLLAGAPSVLASLWMVDDAATAALMKAFYQGLAYGQRPAAALRAAQLAQARKGAHPFHWAAFALHGQA